jgi:hypothetical protein
MGFFQLFQNPRISVIYSISLGILFWFSEEIGIVGPYFPGLKGLVLPKVAPGPAELLFCGGVSGSTSAWVSLYTADFMFSFLVCPRCLWLRARVSSRRWSSSPGNWKCLGQRSKELFVWTVRLTIQLPLPWATKVSRWFWGMAGTWLGICMFMTPVYFSGSMCL